MSDTDAPAADGGKPYLAWNLSATGDLPESDRALLQALGAAVVTQWFDLPRDIQKRLFDGAAKGPAEVKHHLACFLHAHGEAAH